jgi:hypothetical protein
LKKHKIVGKIIICYVFSVLCKQKLSRFDGIFYFRYVSFEIVIYAIGKRKNSLAKIHILLAILKIVE